MSTINMQAATHAPIDDLPGAFNGHVHLVRTGLGISAFGVNAIDLPAGMRSPEHDETESGQEELYVALTGSGAVVVDGERFALDPDHVTRVSPAAKRYMEGGPDGVRALCIGGTPGRAYEPPAWTEPAE
jgi:uncharacterized cupin superfamily protein